MILPPPLTERSQAIVLVHGAWVGEWSWLPVLGPLRESGRVVHAVSLKGQGARRHESSSSITLADHAADVVGVIETFDLVDVTLVGHSYGGRVVTAAFERVESRLAAIVYLDAHAPTAEDSGPTPERDEIARQNGGMVPFYGYDIGPDLVGGPEGVAWFHERVVAHSYATFNAPWQTDLGHRVRKTYVYCTANQPSVFGQYAAAAKADGSWSYHEIDAPHFVMFSHPDEVAAIILNA